MPRSTSRMIAKIIQPYRRLGGRGTAGAINTGGGVIGGGGGGGGLTGGTFSSIRAEASLRPHMRQEMNQNLTAARTFLSAAIPESGRRRNRADLRTCVAADKNVRAPGGSVRMHLATAAAPALQTGRSAARKALKTFVRRSSCLVECSLEITNRKYPFCGPPGYLIKEG